MSHLDNDNTLPEALVIAECLMGVTGPPSFELNESWFHVWKDRGFDCLSLSQLFKLDAVDERTVSASDSDTHESGGSRGVTKGETRVAPNTGFSLLNQTLELSGDSSLLLRAR